MSARIWGYDPVLACKRGQLREEHIAIGITAMQKYKWRAMTTDRVVEVDIPRNEMGVGFGGGQLPPRIPECESDWVMTEYGEHENHPAYAKKYHRRR